MNALQHPDPVVIFSTSDVIPLPDAAHGSPPSIYELRKNLEAFSKSLRILLPAVADAGAAFGLKTVEVAVGIDAKGKVGFLGVGADVGNRPTIVMTFSR